MPLIAVYGTLRKGGYNHSRFRLEEPIATETLNLPYKMIQLHTRPYPMLIRAKKEHPLVLDFINVSDEMFMHLNRMEEGAGYQATTIKTKHGDATIWFINIDEGQLHPSGYKSMTDFIKEGI